MCDWKRSRGAGVSDETLLCRAFAFIYMGTIIDQELTEELSEELSRQLASDMSSAAEAREAAVQWGLADDISETNPFLHIGYKLAVRILRTDRAIINALAAELMAFEALDREQLQTWFSKHAEPIPFDELENRLSY